MIHRTLRSPAVRAHAASFAIRIRLYAAPDISASISIREGAVAAETLAALVAAHGAPLVLKTDNGSNVAEAEVREALTAMGIAHLRSPRGERRKTRRLAPAAERDALAAAIASASREETMKLWRPGRAAETRRFPYAPPRPTLF